MNNTIIKRYLLSSVSTFLTSFFGALALQFGSNHIIWTSTFLFALLGVAARAGIKAVVEGVAGQHADVTQ